MQKRIRSFLAMPSLILLSILLLTGFTSTRSDEGEKATSGGELTFTIRTVTAGGNYSPKHVLAIWIEHSGDFVKTRKAMANQRKQYLYTWKNASNYNVVDAITGATLTSHQTHTISWDCTDLDGNILPDGDYDVITEFTDKHAQGPLYTLSFTKGPDAISLSPPDETYFKDIALEFTPYIAEFSADVNAICQWGTVTFTDESVNAGSWAWDFGEGAAPATSATQGPHTVYYTTPGIKTVSLTINGGVTETKEEYINVAATPTAGFSYSSSSLTVDFMNLSSNATTYLWDFGDGNTSTENNPTHTYATAGTFDVTLLASYMNCEDYETLPVTVPLVGYEETADKSEIRIYPNPNSGIFTLDPGRYTGIKKIGIFTASGKCISDDIVRDGNNAMPVLMALELESGIYYLRLETGNEVFLKKIIVH